MILVVIHESGSADMKLFHCAKGQILQLRWRILLNNCLLCVLEAMKKSIKLASEIS